MNRSPIRAVAGLIAAFALLLSLGASAAWAKEGVSVNLSAPLPREAQPGTTVAALFTMEAIADDVTEPLHHASVFLRLYGPTGAMTEAAGVEQATPGLYKALIEIPAGGVVRGEFGIHGDAKTASGRVVAHDVVWPYDGIVVTAAVPAPVDPNAFGVQGAKPAPVNPAQAAPAGPAAAGDGTAGTPAATGSRAPALDPWLAFALGVILVAIVAAGWVVGRRRLHASAV